MRNRADNSVRYVYSNANQLVLTFSLKGNEIIWGADGLDQLFSLPLPEKKHSGLLFCPTGQLIAVNSRCKAAAD